MHVRYHVRYKHVEYTWKPQNTPRNRVTDVRKPGFLKFLSILPSNTPNTCTSRGAIITGAISYRVTVFCHDASVRCNNEPVNQHINAWDNHGRAEIVSRNSWPVNGDYSLAGQCKRARYARRVFQSGHYQPALVSRHGRSSSRIIDAIEREELCTPLPSANPTIPTFNDSAMVHRNSR